jgi:hypothetical protein
MPTFASQADLKPKKISFRRMEFKYSGYPIYEHCMPHDVSRTYDEARGITHLRLWIARRDREMWKEIA